MTNVDIFLIIVFSLFICFSVGATVTSHVAHYDWAGNHCPNREQKKFIAETYYIYRRIYEETTKERAKTENFPLGNVYLGETLRCKDSGEPITLSLLSDQEK